MVEQLPSDELIAHAKKVANCIFIATEQPIALDVSNTIRQLIVEIEGYRAELRSLSGKLNSIRAHIDHTLNPTSGFAKVENNG